MDLTQWILLGIFLAYAFVAILLTITENGPINNKGEEDR